MEFSNGSITRVDFGMVFLDESEFNFNNLKDISGDKVFERNVLTTQSARVVKFCSFNGEKTQFTSEDERAKVNDIHLKSVVLEEPKKKLNTLNTVNRNGTQLRRSCFPQLNISSGRSWQLSPTQTTFYENRQLTINAIVVANSKAEALGKINAINSLSRLNMLTDENLFCVNLFYGNKKAHRGSFFGFAETMETSHEFGGVYNIKITFSLHPLCKFDSFEDLWDNYEFFGYYNLNRTLEELLQFGDVTFKVNKKNSLVGLVFFGKGLFSIRINDGKTIVINSDSYYFNKCVTLDHLSRMNEKTILGDTFTVTMSGENKINATVIGEVIQYV